jgi:Ca2+-binding RTX toxin-like protein
MRYDGTVGIDNLVGSLADDQLYGLDGNDTLTGRLGNDLLDGGQGSDIYRFNRGDGQDQIQENSLSSIDNDLLIFSGAGLTAANVVVTRISGTDDLKISFKGGITDSIVLKNQLSIGFAYGRGIESIQFSDGIRWNEAQLWNSYLTLGASTNDVLTGTDSNDVLIGGLGNDLLIGNLGSDTYRFNRGDGQDQIQENSLSSIDNDLLTFSGVGLTAANVVVTRVSGTDDLKISFKGGITDSIVLKNQLSIGFAYGRGIESIQFSDGIRWNEAQLWNSYLTLGASTNDVLAGTDSNDVLIGGLGNDLLIGNLGSDTYRFNRGDGQDQIQENSLSSIDTDLLIFSGAGLTAANVVVTRISNTDDLKISFKGGITDSIVLKNQLSISFAYGRGIESIQFSDGIRWNEAQLWNSYLTLGASTNDVLEGTNGNDFLNGGAGNDRLIGGLGADRFIFDINTAFNSTIGLDNHLHRSHQRSRDDRRQRIRHH